MKTIALAATGLAAAGAALCFALAPTPAPAPKPKQVTRAPAGRNVTLEIEADKGQRRRVVVAAEVCLREGLLEHLLTRKGTKEHEAVLSADVDARDVHKALLAAGGTPGRPARYSPAYTPADGQPIRVSVEWQEKGATRRVRAGEWVRQVRTGKAMDHDWVFAGSLLVTDPNQPGRQVYLANEGDVVCVANFEGSLLDLPVRSPKEQEDLAFEAFTPSIPPLGTRVNLILEPMPVVKK